MFKLLTQTLYPSNRSSRHCTTRLSSHTARSIFCTCSGKYQMLSIQHEADRCLGSDEPQHSKRPGVANVFISCSKGTARDTARQVHVWLVLCHLDPLNSVPETCGQSRLRVKFTAHSLWACFEYRDTLAGAPEEWLESEWHEVLPQGTQQRQCQNLLRTRDFDCLHSAFSTNSSLQGKSLHITCPGPRAS